MHQFDEDSVGSKFITIIKILHYGENSWLWWRLYYFVENSSGYHYSDFRLITAMKIYHFEKLHEFDEHALLKLRYINIMKILHYH